MEKLDAYTRMKQLVEELNKHTELYDAGHPVISDAVWDKMYFELSELERQFPSIVLPESPTQKVNYTVVTELQKVKHNHPMLSLDKTKDWNEFVKYFMNKDVVGMTKLDGLTCSLRYMNGALVSAETRGNGEEGEDILHNALVVKNIPKRIDYADELIVDGEIICTKKDFEEFKEEYANPRNFASGSIRLFDSKECAGRNLRFVLWNVIKGPCSTVIANFEKMQNLGFEVTPWTSSFDWDAKEFLVERAEEYGYPIDGLVGRFNDVSFGESLGTTGHHSRAAYAFKFYDELYDAKLLDIEWTMGKTNTITPTAVFETVNIDGTDVSRASLHNISIIKNLGLTNNCTVRVYKAKQIVPQIDSCDTDGNGAIVIPSICPVCGGKTAITKENESEVLVCTNQNCSGKLLGRLKFFVSKPAMNIDGLSKATLEFLIAERWVKKFKDIYHLDKYRYEWEQFDGFGEKSVGKILDAIKKSRSVTCANFITALSINGVGKSAAKTISDAFNGDFNAFYEAFKSDYDWAELEDIGSITASNITKYLRENEAEIVDLAAEMLFVTPKKVEVVDSPLSGLKFCITGSFSQSRNVLKKKLEDRGAKFVSGVSKNLDVLFCGERAGTKLTKARSFGVRVVDENGLMKLLGE